MNIRLSHRARDVRPSPTLAVSALAKKMVREGIEVINFGVGEPDFNTPEIIKQAAKKAIDDNFTRYTPSAGIPDLKQAIIHKFQRDNGLVYQPENILVSPGAKASLINVLMAVCDPRDDVIIPSPYWVSYTSQVWLCDAHPAFIETKAENNFKLTASQLEEKLKDLSNPKALILNSPNNPTGAVYNEKELAEIGEVCLKNELVILSDEIYERLVYDGVEHVSIASLSPELQDITIVVNGVSKAFAMTGWRLGYMAGAKNIIQKASEIQSHTTSCVNSITQKACIVALEEDDGSVEKMRLQFSKRREYMIERLEKIEDITFLKPKGAFYVMVNLSEYLKSNTKGINNSKDFCRYLLQEYHVALVSGNAFGVEGYVRFSYANSMDNIRKGIDLFEQGLKSLK